VGQAGTACQRRFQEPLKLIAADLDRAKAREMAGDELRVEKAEAAIDQSRHKIDEGDFARIARPGEHALAEKGAAKMDAVKSAGEPPVLPDFDCVAMTELKQVAIEAPDAAIDPGRAPA
jgi:hypothetical protein